MKESTKTIETANAIIQKKEESSFIRDSKPGTEEIKRLYERLNKNHEIRNQLIMFSFTSVIATLGAALAIDDIDVLCSLLFLFPLVILIPFQARISYYRLEEAHVMSYTRMLSPENEKYRTLCIRGYREDVGIKKSQYKFIAWFVNHELVWLSLLSASVFCLEFFTSVGKITKQSLAVGIVAPAVLILILFYIAESTYSFENMVINYEKKLEIMREEYDRQTIGEDNQQERATS